jgi:zinc protease
LTPKAAPAHRPLVPLLAALLPAWLALAPAGDPLDAHYRLANGLEVILRRDPRLPLVAVHLRYHVGAVDDPPARRGLAHLVEHLMFEGSRHIDSDARQAARAAAFIHHDNAETDLHTSEYYTLAPKDDLATILWLESDRLGFLRGSAGAVALARVKAIVAQERRQRRETDPRGARVERLFARLFPPAHPYHDTVIGPHDAIAAVTLRDVDAFLATHYTPDNATLTLVGDLPPDTRAHIDRYFADLPPAPVPPDRHPPALPRLPGGGLQRERVSTGGPPSALCGWATPGLHADGDAALDVLFAALRAGAFRRLAGPDLPRVAAFDAEQFSQPQQSVAVAELIGPPGSDPAELLATIDRVLARVAAGELQEPEILRARLRLAHRLRVAPQDLVTRAGMLSGYAAAFADPDHLEQDAAQWLAVTPADVAAAASSLLTATRRAAVLATPP